VLRIVAGKLRGRVLDAARGAVTRPTAARVREALFDVLEHGLDEGLCLEGARVLDLFAGTGALGFEALSRGAAHVRFIDGSRQAKRAIDKNLQQLRAEDASDDQCVVSLGTLPGALRTLDVQGPGYDLVFMDPPYAAAQLADAVLTHPAFAPLLAPNAVIVIEGPARNDERQNRRGGEDGRRNNDAFRLIDTRRWAEAQVRFFRFVEKSVEPLLQTPNLETPNETAQPRNRQDVAETTQPPEQENKTETTQPGEQDETS